MDDLHGAQFGHRSPVLLCTAVRQCEPTDWKWSFNAMELGPDWLRRTDELRFAGISCAADVQHDARGGDTGDRFAEHSDSRVAAARPRWRSGGRTANSGDFL